MGITADRGGKLGMVWECEGEIFAYSSILDDSNTRATRGSPND